MLFSVFNLIISVMSMILGVISAVLIHWRDVLSWTITSIYSNEVFILPVSFTPLLSIIMT